MSVDGQAIVHDDVVGRDAELAALFTFLDPVREGAAAFLLEGEAGIGKTTIWRRGLNEATARGYRVLSCTPAETETQFGFAGLRDVLDGVADEAGATLPEPQRRALAVALLHEEPGTRPPADAAIAAGLLGALRALAGGVPLLVAIDDVQWLDPSSEAALRFAIRRLRDEPVSVLLSMRAESGRPAPLDLERSLPAERVARIRLGPLSMGAAHHLLRKELGVSFARPLLTRLHETSGGNPFFILELARALARVGGHPDPGEPLPVPITLHEVVRSRIASLPATAHEPLLAAAALSAPTLALVREATAAEGAAHLSAVIEAEILTVRDGRIRFTHPLLASEIYAMADDERRRSMHGRLAAAVEDPEEHARHLALAANGPDPVTAAALDEAARHAAGRGAPAAAAELAELAAKATPPDEMRAMRARLIDAAAYHHTAGQNGRARAILGPLVDQAEPGRERAKALFLHGRTEMMLERSEGLCEQALAEAAGDSALSATICHWLGLLSIVRGDLIRGRERAGDAVSAAEVSDDAAAIISALSLVLLVDMLAGRGVPRAPMRQALDLEQEAGGAPLYYSPSLVDALNLMHLDHVELSRARFDDVLARAVDLGDEEILSAVCFHRAQLEWRAGQWSEAHVWRARGHEATQQGDLTHREGLFFYLEAFLAAHEGRRAEAEAAAAKALSLLEPAGDVLWEIQTRTLLGFYHLSLGEAAVAVGYLEPLPERLEEMGYGEPSYCQAIPYLVEAFVELGRFDEAEPLLDGYGVRAGDLDSPLALSQAARCRALLAAAKGHGEKALSLLEAAFAHLERVPGPFERGRALLVQGAVQRRLKRRRLARESLDESLAIFEHLGAGLWAERARAELARIGGRQASGDQLTPSERRVAELAAEGRSNREIAAALSITVHTVEGALTRAYGKLAVKSRTQLAQRLGQEGASKM
jgi:DNA-binding CsgD family transcriptional regulator